MRNETDAARNGPRGAAKGSYGVIFATRAPSGAYGMVNGQGDRLVARRMAERRCAAGGPIRT